MELDVLEPTKDDLMISKTISRAACLAELTSNPKSFFNCPDLHGGPGLPEGSFRSGKKTGVVSKTSEAWSGEIGATSEQFRNADCELRATAG